MNDHTVVLYTLSAMLAIFKPKNNNDDERKIITKVGDQRRKCSKIA